MKIGILTQPLQTNYGGLLQCWALQQTLKTMGHDPWVVQRVKNHHTFAQWLRICLRNAVCLLLGRPRLRWISRADEAIIRRQTNEFTLKQITPRTAQLFSTHALLTDYELQNYDAYIVGSDQVWRPKYSPCQSDFFLGFLPESIKVKRIAYAASFGTDEWEYSTRLTQQCNRLLRRFDAVSVRESDGVVLCADHFDMTATQTLDPTLLLDATDYEALVTEASEEQSPGDLFCYLLDRSEAKQQSVRQAAARLGLTPFERMPRAMGMLSYEVPIEERIVPRVTQWLRAFIDSRCVVTDSFHGCVFALLFHRPFVAIGNQKRGQSRFHSLLGLFGLEERLVETSDTGKIVHLLKTPVNWDSVEVTLRRERARSFNFLHQALN